MSPRKTVVRPRLVAVPDHQPPAAPTIAKPALERRLLAILAADMVGSSTHMAEDEDATHRALRGALRRVIAPAVARHGGRVVKQTGDGFLATFASASGAVLAAVAFQATLGRGLAGRLAGRTLAFRVGIHVGDVIVESDDVFGHAVNLAFRLEASAEPGGVLISEQVHACSGASLPVLFSPVAEPGWAGAPALPAYRATLRPGLARR